MALWPISYVVKTFADESTRSNDVYGKEASRGNTGQESNCLLGTGHC